MPSDPPAPSLLGRGLRDLAEGKDVLLCDVWGVIHDGVVHHADAVEALARFRASGGTVILVTNAPAPEEHVWARMRRLGVPRDSFDRIATSGDVASALLAAAGCPPVFHIGPKEEVAIYDTAERLGVSELRRVGIEQAERVVCISLDDTGDEPEDYDDLLRRLLARRLTMVCANPDIVVGVGDALVHCAGAIAERYAAMGGEVVQTGKPFPAIYDRARAMAEAIRGSATAPGRMLAIGDAAHTDLAGAAREGIDALLITGGIHRAALHPGGIGSPDEAALRRFLGETGAAAAAAMPGLAW